MPMLDKTYRPAEIEAKQYEQWERDGAFAAGQRHNAAPYTIVIPPPNVTGSLHMGHALNNTLQDVLVRFARMRGRDALWQPGTDHAGIATQMVVERQLEAEGKTRHDLGRAAFIERVWEWKAESGGVITDQLRRLGASCDWSRERFTMDEGLSAAVRKVFVELYKDGLIYKDKRLVNWDPKLHTAISDLEVQQHEVDGHLWYIDYPIEGAAGRVLTVATTRPETMLGDTAVAVHPDDERYRDLIGKHAILPLVGRRLPIVADEYTDPEQGSGAVKITPAHDFNDFEVGRRHGLEMVNIFDASARINDNAPAAYRGLDRFEARRKVVTDLDAAGRLAKIADHRHTVPHGDRSGTVVEPWLTDQWYVDAQTLAKPAIAAVEDGRTRFVPENWSKTYFEWMRNIQPWCISRQLWWGHQIPAWYGPDGEIFVAMEEAAAIAAARAHYGEDTELARDQDVLDTWFSSALWPFSTLGWPDQTPALARYYPTDVLVTGFDIIFFWVARMMMMGLRFMGEVPFHTVYIHALVRDSQGAKMSKSKGNVMDPLELVDVYGADALRFTLIAMAAMGRDIKLATSRVEGYRNFATKLWNAARFCEMNDCKPVADFAPAGVKETVNRWIVGALAHTARDVATALDGYKFDQAASAIYQFVWHTYCDWYLEFAKPILQTGAAAAQAETTQAETVQAETVQAETRATAAWVLGRILALLHPFMPHITEALWVPFGDGETRLIAGSWPETAVPDDAGAAAEMDWAIRLISEIRAVRSEANVPAAAKIAAVLRGADATSTARLAAQEPQIVRLARLSGISVGGEVPTGSVQLVIDEATLALPLADIIDLAQEQARLAREIERLGQDIGKLDKKLANPSFLAKAPPEVVAEQRERRAEAEAARTKLAAAAKRLSVA